MLSFLYNPTLTSIHDHWKNYSLGKNEGRIIALEIFKEPTFNCIWGAKMILWYFYFSFLLLSAFLCGTLHVQLAVALWTVAHQASLSVGFFRQEYWSGLLFPTPGDLPNPGIEYSSLTTPTLAGGFFTSSSIILFIIRTKVLDYCWQ